MQNDAPKEEKTGRDRNHDAFIMAPSRMFDRELPGQGERHEEKDNEPGIVDAYPNAPDRHQVHGLCDHGSPPHRDATFTCSRTSGDRRRDRGPVSTRDA